MMEQVRLLTNALADKRTPWYARALVILTLAYIISPIDLIPDIIPVIGLLDELILLPIVYTSVMRLVPDEVKHEIAVVNRTEQQQLYLKFKM